MKRISLSIVWTGASVCLVAPVLMGASINYRENWDSYATGRTDPVYTQVWTCDVPTDYPDIGTGNPSTPPNAIQLALKDRTLTNDLTDGITNGTAAGTEMGAGQVVKPGQAPLGDPTNLILEYRVTFGVGGQRANASSYMEASFNGQHAPTSGTLTGPVYPVLAIGNLNTKFTDWNGAGTNNNQPYFFNGQTWLRCGNSTFTFGTAPNNNQQLYATIYYDSGLGKWQAEIKLVGGLYNGINVYDLAFDPTAQGFNTVGWAEKNVSPTSWTGNPQPMGDDVALSGGIIVPEPASLMLLTLGGLTLIRRRRNG
jgi:hypothetical protein